MPNDVKLQSENGFPVDENLRPLKIGGKSSSLELSQHENLQHRFDIVIDDLGKIKKWNAEIKSDLKVYVDLTMKGK